MNLRQGLAEGIARLKAAGIDGAARDARALLAEAAGIAPGRVMLEADMVLSDPARFRALIARRAAGEPVSRILGRRQFWGRDFTVTRDTLDPRPETELLVGLAASEPFTRVLDLGTGSGCIVLSLLLEQPQASGVATDVSPEAMRIAGENAARLGVADRLILPLSDWFMDVGGRYDLIVSNPPYIAADEMAVLDPDVRDFEPRQALTDEADGLTAYRIIAANALNHLTPGGRILVEIGPMQAEAVSALFQEAGLEDIRTHTDLVDRDRVIAARAAKSSF